MSWKRAFVFVVVIFLGLSLGEQGWAQGGGEDVTAVQAEVSVVEKSSELTEGFQGENYEGAEKPSFTDTYPGKLVPFAGMGVAVIIVWIVMAMVQNTDRYRHETIRSYLDKGVEVPHQLLVDGGDPQTWKPTSDLRKAMVWLAVGLGLGMTGYIFSGSPKALALGLIFDFIGIGYLIVWKIEPRKENEALTD